ncbi:hypothetical protein [Nocardia lijiangensis]|uniref:hypothetical protein n=1 Tax=Nocardia lijiangensis TaxID=299618 RepID=UPI000835217A|nr:hypothetical protein [Nocardia lijiangensis]
MSQHSCLRTAIVALAGAALLTVGSAALQAPEAAAVPGGPSATQVEGPFSGLSDNESDDNPFAGLSGEGSDDNPFAGLSGESSDDKSDKKSDLDEELSEQADKAEKNGGGVTTAIIDLVANVIKCGLNIAIEAVKCKL